MNPKIEKLEKEIEKTQNEDRGDAGKAPRAGETENGAGKYRLCGGGRAFHLTPQQLAEFLEITAGRPFRRLRSAGEQEDGHED